MTRSDIHGTVNLALTLLFEVTAIAALWMAPWFPIYVKAIGTLFLFFVVLFICHRLVPQLTNSPIEHLFKDLEP